MHPKKLLPSTDQYVSQHVLSSALKIVNLLALHNLYDAFRRYKVGLHASISIGTCRSAGVSCGGPSGGVLNGTRVCQNAAIGNRCSAAFCCSARACAAVSSSTLLWRSWSTTLPSTHTCPCIGYQAFLLEVAQSAKAGTCVHVCVQVLTNATCLAASRGPVRAAQNCGGAGLPLCNQTTCCVSIRMVMG
jgi:hypothetical protein